MTSYDYRGYVIFEDNEGYFIVDDCEFTSFDEACDWVDDQYESDPAIEETSSTILRTYHIFYVTKDYSQGFDDFIEAYSEDDAEQRLRRRHPDIAYIADCYPID